MGFCRRHISRSDCTECTQVNVATKYKEQYPEQKKTIKHLTLSQKSSGCYMSGVNVF